MRRLSDGDVYFTFLSIMRRLLEGGVYFTFLSIMRRLLGGDVYFTFLSIMRRLLGGDVYFTVHSIMRRLLEGGVYKRGPLKEEIPSITTANQYSATFCNKYRNVSAVLMQKAFDGMVNRRR